MGIGDRIKECRKRKKLNQAELAAHINRTPQVISNWERGYTPVVPHDDVLRLAIALETTPNYLTGLTDDPAPSQAKQDKPNFEEYVLSAPTLSDATIRIAELDSRYGMDDKTFTHLSRLAYNKFGLPGAKGSPKAAGGIPNPGTGALDEE